jgi:hypothetical protein
MRSRCLLKRVIGWAGSAKHVPREIRSRTDPLDRHCGARLVGLNARAAPRAVGICIASRHDVAAEVWQAGGGTRHKMNARQLDRGSGMEYILPHKSCLVEYVQHWRAISLVSDGLDMRRRNIVPVTPIAKDRYQSDAKTF